MAKRVSPQNNEAGLRLKNYAKLCLGKDKFGLSLWNHFTEICILKKVKCFTLVRVENTKFSILILVYFLLNNKPIYDIIKLWKRNLTKLQTSMINGLKLK